MSICSSDYQYESLQGRPVDTIRLLTLQPGQVDDQICCSLSYARQSERPRYSALSYVWGTTKSDHVILVNNRLIFVKENLYSFLRHLRHIEKPMRIWVDAISINQEDLAERGHQVRLMGRIYQDAQFVYAWLGEDSHGLVSCLKEQLSLQVDFMELRKQATITYTRKPATQAFRQFSSSSKRRHQDLEHLADLEHLKSQGQGDLLNNERQLAKDKIWNIILAVVDLCRRQYWTRTWIVQELLLAKRRVVCVGNVQVPWDDFRGLIDLCGDCRPDFALQSDALHDTIRLVENFVRTTRAQLQRFPLGIIMERYSHQHCLDTRDNVYAFLSLASDCDDVVPNYETNTLELFFQLKDRVTDHVTLQKCLALPSDEIRYYAELHGLAFNETFGYLCVRCTEESDKAWDKRIHLTRLQRGVYVPQYVMSELSDFPYTAKAIYDYNEDNRGGEFGSGSFSFTKNEILGVSSPFPAMWLVKKKDGSMSRVDPRYLVLLKEQSDNYRHEQELARVLRRGIR
jgi:hypothetical protein